MSTKKPRTPATPDASDLLHRPTIPNPAHGITDAAIDTAALSPAAQELLRAARGAEVIPATLPYASWDEMVDDAVPFLVLAAAQVPREGEKDDIELTIYRLDGGQPERLRLAFGLNKPRAQWLGLFPGAPVGPCKAVRRPITSGKWAGKAYKDIMSLSANAAPLPGADSDDADALPF